MPDRVEFCLLRSDNFTVIPFYFEINMAFPIVEKHQTPKRN